jgi:hypothetical protein
MSQSDYIKHKRVSNELYISDMAAVLNSQKYTDYKQYALENTIKNTNTIFSRIVPSDKRIIFDMEMDISNCPTFIVCNDTNTRPNRVALSETLYYPRPVPVYVKKGNTICDTSGNMYCNLSKITNCKCSS